LGAGLLRIAQHVAKRAGQHPDAAKHEDELFRDLAAETDLVMTTIMVMQSLASCLMTSNTPHPFRSGSSAEVGPLGPAT
jgi:fido (protein-threonine AMPylation protein)